ncbi:hypothetical protein [Evansella halocellulosilytica]|uniref:hypothetical protein n=1 Tax=Evansella halocellulosilytica TaxID=2011013 RepID=UPI0015CD2A24|nr:hypothetical protein [Evansella halocellulosilytica]
MSGLKVWVFTGVIYLALVIAGYSFITGANPLESGGMHEDHEHDNGEEEYVDDHDSHTDHSESEDSHDHGDAHGESEVLTHVKFEEGRLEVRLEDEDGQAPELLETHERYMHLIIVRDDLEEYHHFHPEQVNDGVFEADAPLEDGQYYVFVDINPKNKQYVIEPNRLDIGEAPEQTPSLMPDENLTKALNGKEVELNHSPFIVGEEVTLSFDLKGETPKPYLGALGHVVIIDEDVEKFIHVHPVSDDKTEFEAHFPETGTYKLWAEFKYEDAGVLTFPFVVNVE